LRLLRFLRLERTLGRCGDFFIDEPPPEYFVREALAHLERLWLRWPVATTSSPAEARGGTRALLQAMRRALE
jgi:hypothetical protein